MVRKIEFRVWDIDKKEFEYYSFVELCAGSSQFLTECADYGDEGFYKNFNVTQYTGLKDSEGNEIYEGDILTAEFNLCGMVVSPVGSISFSKGGYLISGWNIAPEFLVDFLEGMDWSKQKIIGNIYENPELFEKCKI